MKKLMMDDEKLIKKIRIAENRLFWKPDYEECGPQFGPNIEDKEKAVKDLVTYVIRKYDKKD